MAGAQGGAGPAARFALVAGVRREEVCGATWGEFDLDSALWTISSARRKDTRSRSRKKQVPTLPFVIPLSWQALAVLREAREAEDARREMLDLPKTSAEDLAFVTERGTPLMNWDRWLKHVSSHAVVRGWSMHALRRTCATFAGELGAEPHVISVLLGHKNVGGQLVAGYSKARYQAEHKEALARVGDYIESLLTPYSAEILPLRRS